MGTRPLHECGTLLPLKQGAAGQEELTEAQESKAHWLYRWGSAAGVAVSRDEVRDMLRRGRLDPRLQDVWEAKRAQQKHVIAICDAAVSGDAAALQVYIFLSSEWQ
jgi:hypothetical protein